MRKFNGLCVIFFCFFLLCGINACGLLSSSESEPERECVVAVETVSAEVNFATLYPKQKGVGRGVAATRDEAIRIARRQACGQLDLSVSDRMRCEEESTFRVPPTNPLDDIDRLTDLRFATSYICGIQGRLDEVAVNELSAPLPPSPPPAMPCIEGTDICPGQSCGHPNGTTFTVLADGRGRLGSSSTMGTGISISTSNMVFVATRNRTTNCWAIIAVR